MVANASPPVLVGFALAVWLSTRRPGANRHTDRATSAAVAARADVQETLKQIEQGTAKGRVFYNLDCKLPRRAPGYYREYIVEAGEEPSGRGEEITERPTTRRTAMSDLSELHDAIQERWTKHFTRAAAVHLLDSSHLTDEQISARLSALPKTELRTLSGLALKKDQSAIAAFATALSFPDFRSHNWDAVADRIRDLQWFNAERVVLLIRNPGVLAGRSHSIKVVRSILSLAVADWRLRPDEREDPDGPVWSFHFVLPAPVKDLRRLRTLPGGVLCVQGVCPLSKDE